MKNKTLLFLVILFSLFSFPETYAQQIADTTEAQYLIETKDGNEFTGVILEENMDHILLFSERYGEISIPMSNVKRKEELKSEDIVDGEHWFENPHASRYFYGPNGYGIKKGEGYYQNTWVFFNQLSYGLTDEISFGVGMMPLFLFAGAPTPVWVTPKVSIPLIKDKLNVGAGVLAAYVLGEGVGFGIGYGSATIGNTDHNLSLGFGWAYGEGEWAPKPTFMLGGMTRVSRKVFLLSENYYIDLGDDFSAGMVSFGARFVQKKLAIDAGLFVPLASEMGSFFAVPWLGITVPFDTNR